MSNNNSSTQTIMGVATVAMAAAAIIGACVGNESIRDGFDNSIHQLKAQVIAANNPMNWQKPRF